MQLSCSAIGIPSVRNYRFYVNDILVGNTTNGILTVKVSPSNCANFSGEYKCIPESTIGDGEMKTVVREFNRKFFMIFLSLKPFSLETSLHFASP